MNKLASTVILTPLYKANSPQCRNVLWVQAHHLINARSGCCWNMTDRDNVISNDEVCRVYALYLHRRYGANIRPYKANIC
jgi:hypothetical protein